MGRKLKCFPHGEGLEEYIVLHDVIGEVTESFEVILCIVGVYFSLKMFGGNSACEHVEEGGLACTRGSHDGGKLSRLEDARNTFQKLLLDVLLRAGRLKTCFFIWNLNGICYVLKDNINWVLAYTNTYVF